MNVYDFDNTIYAGDSTIDFYVYCLKKYPKILLKLPKQLYGAIQYKAGKITKTEFKQNFFCFLYEIPEIKVTVNDFWDANQHKIKSWYKEQQKDDDLVISASPEFLLQNICMRLGINNLIASKVNEKTGEFLSLNCHGEEKKARYKDIFNNATINKFYSDSRSDKPLAELSQQSFLVQKKGIISWKIQKMETKL